MAARTNLELLRSQEYADRMRRIVPLSLAARAAKYAEREAYRQSAVAATSSTPPRDKRTREYREWLAKQPT